MDTGIDRRNVVLLRSAQYDDPYEAAFEAAGYRARCVPVLAFDMINREVLAERLAHPNRYAGLIVTSPRAVDALDEVLCWLPQQVSRWEARPAYAVGPRTADELRTLGFEPQGEESGDAEGLAAYVARCTFDRPLLFLSGNRRLDTLPTLLDRLGIAIEELCVYETRLRADLDLGDEPAGWIVFFSPSGVEAFVGADLQAPDAGFAAIGPTTAAAVDDAGLSVAAVAETPSPDALVEAISQVDAVS